MGSPFNTDPAPAPTAAAPSSTAITMLNAALGIGTQLAGDAATIAATLGKTGAASKITAGIQTFQAEAGPIQDLEQLAVSVLSMMTTLFHSHAAIKAS